MSAMPDMARGEYGEGDGDALKEKEGRHLRRASFCSSSRMIYNLSKGKIKNVKKRKASKT